MPRVALVAVLLITVQLVVRVVLAFGGYFYWDDLILVGRAGTGGLLSPSYLFDDHDGHVMPGAFLVAGAIIRVAPLVWTGPAISLVVLQLLESLALLRALYVISSWRPVLLIPRHRQIGTPSPLIHHRQIKGYPADGQCQRRRPQPDTGPPHRRQS